MGSHLSRQTTRSAMGRKGVVLAVLAGLHGVAIAGLMRMGFAPREVADPAQPVEVVLFPEQPVEKPPEDVARLQPIDFRVPLMPEVETPIVDAPAPVTAITVVKAERPPEAVPTPMPDVDVPLNVDEVEYLARVPPRYPVAARRARAEGTVYLRIFIDQEGIPREVRVHQSSGHQSLDEAAKEAARRFRFKPHRVNGVPRNVQAIVPVEFSLTVRLVQAS